MVGSTAFDDIEVDESLALKALFDLVVYHPPTRRPDLIEGELDQIESLLDKPAIWIGPSGDPKSDLIVKRIGEIERKHHKITFYPDLPRPKFLGLLKHCERIIGNSSCLFLEAPAFLKSSQIIHIGIRNLGREVVKVRRGGSGRIVKILRRELENL